MNEKSEGLDAEEVRSVGLETTEESGELLA